MMRRRAVAIGGVLATALAAVPVSSALAGGGHGGYGHRGGHAGYGYYGFNPVVGPATAIVGVAAAIVTAPIAILAAASGPPYHGPAPYCGPPGARHYGPPQGREHYGGPGRSCYAASTPDRGLPPGNYNDNGNHGANGSPPARYTYPR